MLRDLFLLQSAYYEKNTSHEKRQNKSQNCHLAPMRFKFSVRNSWRVNDPETKLLPVPGHHLLFHLLAIHRIEPIPGQGIVGFRDLLLDELLALRRPIERFLPKSVFPLIQIAIYEH